jgi:hypothetical protein
MQIRIDKHIPVPKRTKIPELPLKMMETGDSFIAPIDADNPVEVRALRQRVSRWQRGTTSRFSVIRDGDDMRVFRVA